MSIEFSIEKIPTADISVSAEWVQPLIEAFFEIEPDSGMALVAKLTNKELSVLRSALKKNAPHGVARDGFAIKTRSERFNQMHMPHDYVVEEWDKQLVKKLRYIWAEKNELQLFSSSVENRINNLEHKRLKETEE